MNPMFVLADLHSQGSLHRLAYSARPDAPVQAVPARRRLARLRPGTGPTTPAVPRRRPPATPVRHRPARPAVGRP